MRHFIDRAVPHFGFDINWTPIFHFFRDLLFAFLLWQIGFRNFQAAFATMLISGFYEVGQGVSARADGSPNFFDFFDFFPSVIAGFLMVSFMSQNIALALFLDLILIYIATVLLLLLLNKMLGREIIVKM
ncbi:MAG: hypothetical protein ACE5HX_17320 [bacterium]